MTCIEDYLQLHATNCGNKVAIVCGDDNLTYQQLFQRATERASLLRSKGGIVIERTIQTIDFVVTYLAAHIANVPIAPLEKSVPETGVADIQRIVNGCDIPNDVADILFTTGSTGVPKGVMITHKAILANAENLISAQGFTADHTFIISGPLNHIGSLSKLWPMIVVGGTVVITEGMKDLEAFFHALDYPCAKLATFLVPASLRMLTMLAKERLSGYTEKIDFVETGAAPMSQADMEELCAILPHTRLYNTYASTETGIVATHDYQHDGCIAGCLGRQMRHSEIEILSNGVITCKGATLMKGYIGDDNLTSSILVNGTLHTTDLGHFDEKGRLRLDGRIGDTINVGGYKVSPVEVESVAMRYPAIADCICVSTKHALLGNALKFIYTVRKGSEFSQSALIAHLKQHLEAYKIPIQYEQASLIERTYNGKLNRMYYRS